MVSSVVEEVDLILNYLVWYLIIEFGHHSSR